MTKYLLKRLIKGIGILFVVSFILFSLFSMIPGNSLEANLSPTVSKQKIQIQREYLKLDKPIPIRYLNWVSNIIKGDWGYSFSYKMPSNKVVLRNLRPTLTLGVVATILQICIGVPLGIVGTVNKKWERAIRWISMLSISLPMFFVGLVLKNIFGIKLALLPIGGIQTYGFGGNFFELLWDKIIHLILPSVVLAFGSMGVFIRYTQFFMKDILNSDFVVLAKAKGLPTRRIVTHHCLKNMMLPLITIIGISIPTIFVGSYIVEELFAINGMGRLAIDSFFARDYNLIMAYSMILSTLVILCNIITDFFYHIIDKRVLIGEKKYE